MLKLAKKVELIAGIDEGLELLGLLKRHRPYAESVCPSSRTGSRRGEIAR